MKASLLALLLFSTAALAQKGKISINPNSKLMQDDSGRSVIFHGVNVVYKVAPYIPQRSTFDS